jgi:hypothetical protein
MVGPVALSKAGTATTHASLHGSMSLAAICRGWTGASAKLDPAIVARMGFKRAQRLGEVGGKGGGKDSAPRIGTPIPFRELLLSIARTAAPVEMLEAAELKSRPLFDQLEDHIVNRQIWDDVRPVMTENKQLSKALAEAEASFEFIRLKLIRNLQGPEAEAFWRAVQARDALRALAVSSQDASNPR